MGFRAAKRVFSKVAATVLFACGMASSVLAQGPRPGPSAGKSRSALASPAAHPLPPMHTQGIDLPPAHFQHGLSVGERHAWLLLGLADHGAAFFDARTTREAMKHYQELDPLLRPFAHSAALYPVMQIAPTGLDWLALRLATSRHRWLRRIWWLPQAAATAGFVWSGVHNLRLPTPVSR